MMPAAVKMLMSVGIGLIASIGTGAEKKMHSIKISLHLGY